MRGSGDAESWAWPLTVAVIISIPEAISFLGSILQRSRIGSPLPKELEGIYDPAEYETSNRYTRAKSTFEMAKSIWDFGVFMVFWFMKGFPWLDELCSSVGWTSQIATGLLFIFTFALGFQIIDLPWDIYKTFVLEEKFGFNKTTPCTFVKDQLKGIALMTLLGIPILSMVLWFFISAGANAWLYVFLALSAIILFMAFLAPVLILPIFSEMKPLPEGTALITSDAATGAPDFLCGRTFNECEDKSCWKTWDRRFAGSPDGEVLSIVPGAAEGQWHIKEGQPDGDGKVYATLSGDLTTSKPWELTEAARAAASDSSNSDSAKGGSARENSTSVPLQPKELHVTSIDQSSLRSRILAMADKLGYHGANIYVMDGSTRSAHANAFCTGFGRFRRICLYDTMLPLMSEAEILSVVGHEIGHDRLYHVQTNLVFALCSTFVQMYALGQSLSSTTISSAFFIQDPKVYVGLVLFSTVWSIVEFVVQIPLTVHSRSNEFAADRYSVDADKTFGPLLCSGLTKMVKKSMSNLTPHPFYAFLNYSHPQHDTRVRAIQEYHSLKYS